MIKKATVYDVAKAANTSIATVSRVMNNKDYPVKEDLVKRVLEEAKNLNYTPNLIGRQLKSKKSNDIGVIIPNITNEFYPQLILGIEYTARENGYNVLLCNTQRNPNNERKYLESLFQKQVQGIIISSLKKYDISLKRLIANDARIVLLEQDMNIDCNKVIVDYEKGGYLATKHLVDLGHKEIAFFSSPLNKYSRLKVYKGFTHCLELSGIQINKDNIFISEEEEELRDEIYEFNNGKILANRMLSRGDLPTSIFCINDMTAIGAIQVLQKNKIRIPGDISVVGFDNIPISQIISPTLTTIDQSTYKMGTVAAKVLLRALKEDKEKKRTFLFEPSLIVRDSTKKFL